MFTTSPAAFGRLCVETITPPRVICGEVPAAFGRLCVETRQVEEQAALELAQPPSGGCVLKRIVQVVLLSYALPAAFGRLCVETVYC